MASFKNLFGEVGASDQTQDFLPFRGASPFGGTTGLIFGALQRQREKKSLNSARLKGLKSKAQQTGIRSGLGREVGQEKFFQPAEDQVKFKQKEARQQQNIQFAQLLAFLSAGPGGLGAGGAGAKGAGASGGFDISSLLSLLGGGLNKQPNPVNSHTVAENFTFGQQNRVV